MLWLGLFLLAVSLVFFMLENVLFSIVLAGAALAVFVGTIIHRSALFAGKKTKKVVGETLKEMDEADPSHPTQTQIGEGLKLLGGKTGDHAFLEKNIWTMSSKSSNVRERTGKSSKTFISKFFEWFK